MNTHKNISIDFMKLISGGNIREAFEKYTSSDFIHHNPRFKGNAESLITAMEESHKMIPHRVYEIKHAIEDDNLVAIHGSVQLVEKKLNLALVHIFRFKNDKIVELWDIGEEIPRDSINENGMF